MIKKYDMPLKRGMDAGICWMGIKDVRKSRKPRGMKASSAKKLNEWLVSNGHNDRSKSVIATSGNTNMFGVEYFIFPMGNFSYTWIDSKDINYDDERTGWNSWAIKRYLDDPDGFDAYSRRLDKPFKDSFHTDKEIDIAYRREYEIWIDCKKYLFIRTRLFGWDMKTQMVVE
jgi:hypothetical protein